MTVLGQVLVPGVRDVAGREEVRGVSGQWPEPYLQPDRTKDCGYYAQAYLARCLGHPDVTAGQVREWRESTGKHEAYFAQYVLGAKTYRHGDAELIGERGTRLFWLGQGELPHRWARAYLGMGWIAQVSLHRIQPMAHAVVLLEADDDGVLLMDPISGHVREPWSWFLGPGPRDGREDWPGVAADGRPWHGCTFVEGWYRAADAGGAC